MTQLHNRMMMGVVLVAGLTLAGGCEGLGFEKPSARVVGANVGKVNVTSTELVFDVAIDNPYQVPLPLGNLDYALSSDGVEFLNGQAPVQGSIPAGASKTIQLPVTVPYRNVYQAVSNLKGKREIPYEAELGLSVETPVLGTQRLPLKRTGQLPLPRATDALDLLRR